MRGIVWVEVYVLLTTRVQFDWQSPSDGWVPNVLSCSLEKCVARRGHEKSGMKWLSRVCSVDSAKVGSRFDCIPVAEVS